MINGFINLNKESGKSSAYPVGRIKYKLKEKVGHMGTLDPMASGVLPIGVGKAARLFNYLLDKRKKYIAEFTFGYSTDTIDSTGTTLAETSVIPSKEEIEKVLPSLCGEIMQIPPSYSAKMVNGQRSYCLARNGQAVELEAKKVVINKVRLIEQISENTFKFEIDCLGGTYIRSICRDIAEKVDSLAVMSSLIRTQSGIFTIDKSIKLDEVLSSENISELIIPPDQAINFDKIYLSKNEAFKALNGAKVLTERNDGLYRLYDDSFIGIGKVEGGILSIASLIR